MHYLVAYDIADPRRLRRVARLMERRATRCQKSVFLFRGDVPGCLGLGLRHGAYCVGCCWVLMALLFVGGVMNVLWIALLALLVLLEKLTPYGRSVARVAGIACVAAGAWLLLS